MYVEHRQGKAHLDLRVLGIQVDRNNINVEPPRAVGIKRKPEADFSECGGLATSGSRDWRRSRLGLQIQCADSGR
jgi:hypothetical protein